MIDWLISIAFAETGDYAQELPGKLTVHEDLVHARVAHRVLGEELQHLVPVCVDHALQNLTAGRWPLIAGEPCVGEPCHFVVVVKKRIVFTALLPLWRLQRLLVPIKDRRRSLPLVLLWSFAPLGLEPIFLEFLSGFAQELQIDDQVRLELHESVLFLVVVHASVAFVAHFEAHARYVIIVLPQSVFLESLPAPVQVCYRVEVVYQQLEARLVRVKTQLARRFHFEGALP